MHVFPYPCRSGSLLFHRRRHRGARRPRKRARVDRLPVRVAPARMPTLRRASPSATPPSLRIQSLLVLSEQMDDEEISPPASTRQAASVRESHRQSVSTISTAPSVHQVTVQADVHRGPDTTHSSSGSSVNVSSARCTAATITSAILGDTSNSARPSSTLANVPCQRRTTAAVASALLDDTSESVRPSSSSVSVHRPRRTNVSVASAMLGDTTDFARSSSSSVNVRCPKRIAAALSSAILGDTPISIRPSSSSVSLRCQWRTSAVVASAMMGDMSDYDSDIEADVSST